jgi:hypothetical protein
MTRPASVRETSERSVDCARARNNHRPVHPSLAFDTLLSGGHVSRHVDCTPVMMRVMVGEMAGMASAARGGRRADRGGGRRSDGPSP